MSVGQEKVVRHQELLKFILKLAYLCLQELLKRKVAQNRNSRAKHGYGHCVTPPESMNVAMWGELRDGCIKITHIELE